MINNETILTAMPVDLPFADANAIITRTPVESGMEIPETQILAPSNNTLSLVLDSTPVFLEIGPD